MAKHLPRPDSTSTALILASSISVFEPPEIVLRYPFGGLPAKARTMHTGSPIVHAAIDACIDDILDHRICLEEFMRYRASHGARENHMRSGSEYALNGFRHRAGGTSVSRRVLRVRRRCGQGCPGGVRRCVGVAVIQGGLNSRDRPPKVVGVLGIEASDGSIAH